MPQPRVGLITGTRKGLGRAMAEHFCAKGDQIVGCSRGPSDFAHDGYRHVVLDVADEAGVVRLLAEVRERYGRLDFLINNAGVARMNHVLLTPRETVEGILETNVVGTFLLCREAAKLMVRQRAGRIVNLTSVAVPLRLAGEAAYASSKAAVNLLTQVMAKELGPYGVTCNAVGPGPIDTDLTRHVPREKIDDLLSRLAIPRLTTVADVLNVVEFFLAPESDLVTGQVIYLGGA